MKEQTKFPISEDVCPWCGAECQCGPMPNGTPVFDEEEVRKPTKCRNCGAQYTREYECKFRNIRFLQEHPFSHDEDKVLAEWPEVEMQVITN